MFNNNQSNIDNITSQSNTEEFNNSLDVNNKLKKISFNSNNNYLPIVNESHISLESNSDNSISKSITSLNSESDHTI